MVESLNIENECRSSTLRVQNLELQQAVHNCLWWPDTALMIVISPTKLSGEETNKPREIILQLRMYLTSETLSRVIAFV